MAIFNREDARTVLPQLEKMITDLEKKSAEIKTWLNEQADYVVEQGTSGTWTYIKWNSGRIEAWGTVSKSCAITTTSAPYGGYRTSEEIAWDIPNGIFTSTPVYVTATKSGANSARLMNIHATSSTQLAGYLSSAESTTVTVAISFYVVQI